MWYILSEFELLMHVKKIKPKTDIVTFQEPRFNFQAFWPNRYNFIDI